MEEILTGDEVDLSPNPVFIETGSGISTLRLARLADKLKAEVHSCDFNDSKLNVLASKNAEVIKSVQFHKGDSLQSLESLSVHLERVDFLFLDSAASAMHTFREFKLIEPLLKVGSCLLIDNAAHPRQRIRLTECRKGKILVPFLLASPDWEVFFRPRTADSMVFAIRREHNLFADKEYENPEYVDNWRAHFDKTIGLKQA